MPLRTIQFVAIISIALYLIPTGAHFFELPGKFALAPNEYMIVQKIYAGWAWFGTAAVVALGATLGHAIMVRDDQTALVLSLIACGALAAALAIFFMFIYPLNNSTQSWTVMPESFDAARTQWEYAHAGNALLIFVSLVAMVLAILRHLELDTKPLARQR